MNSLEFGGDVIRGFVFAMVLGVIPGTWSTLYVAKNIVLFPPEWLLGITFVILGFGVAFSLWKTGKSVAAGSSSPTEETGATP